MAAGTTRSVTPVQWDPRIDTLTWSTVAIDSIDCDGFNLEAFE